MLDIFGVLVQTPSILSGMMLSRPHLASFPGHQCGLLRAVWAAGFRHHRGDVPVAPHGARRGELAASGQDDPALHGLWGQVVWAQGIHPGLSQQGPVGSVGLWMTPWVVEGWVTLERLEMDQSCGDGMRILPETVNPEEMYTTQSLNGILSQVPVLMADVALTCGLCWTLSARIGLFYFSVPADRDWLVVCNMMFHVNLCQIQLPFISHPTWKDDPQGPDIQVTFKVAK